MEVGNYLQANFTLFLKSISIYYKKILIRVFKGGWGGGGGFK